MQFLWAMAPILLCRCVCLWWCHWVCFPLSVLSLGPRSQGVSLTSSIKSRINTYLESDGLPVPEASSRQATLPPTKTHNDLAKNMKRLVNQKLSDTVPFTVANACLYPFTVANACQQTGNRLVALKAQPTVTIVIAKHAQRRKWQSNAHSVISPLTSLVWKFQENMPKHFLVGTTTPECNPILNPQTSLKTTNYDSGSTPLIDPTSFGTYIQSLRSVNHPIHRIPKAAHPSFA